VVTTFLTFGLFLVLMIFLAPIIFIASYFYTKVWIKNFRFDFAADKGSIFKKVIGQSTTYLYYDRIQNVSVAQGVLARIFGVYAIMVETAGEQSGSHLGIPAGNKESAEVIKNFLLERARTYKSRL
jgi:putative membrane protein